MDLPHPIAYTLRRLTTMYKAGIDKMNRATHPELKSKKDNGKYKSTSSSI